MTNGGNNMRQINREDKIKIEKIMFIENHSEEFYNTLFNKDEENHSTIYLITSMLLKDDRLEDCEEYSFLNRIVEDQSKETLENSFLNNILTTIVQFLTRLGAEDSVNVILTYFKYNEQRYFETEKTLRLA